MRIIRITLFCLYAHIRIQSRPFTYFVKIEMAITETKAKSAKTQDKVYFLSDDEGLSLKIDPTGSKTWTYRYADPQTKRRIRVKIGNYPDMNLKMARNERDKIKDLLFNKRHKIEKLLFKNIAQDWLDYKIKSALGDMPRGGVIRLSSAFIDNEVLPIIGDRPFSDIKRTDLVDIIRNIESRGVKEPVKKACSYLSQIYDYAVSIGIADFNIATNLNKIMVNKTMPKNYAYLEKDGLPDFIKAIDRVKAHPIIKKALWLKLYTGVRGAELIKAKHSHFDLDKKIWRIPAVNVKQFRLKVVLGAKIPDYVIPLSTQAVDIIHSAFEWSHGADYVFPSMKDDTQHIHFNSINAMIRRAGIGKDALSSHGLRATMSTILYESGHFKSTWIEAQLSHSDSNIVRSKYNHAEYVEHRLKMVQWWADYLSKIQVKYN